MSTAGRECVLSEISEDGVALTTVGRIVDHQRARIGELSPSVGLDAFVIMPNHQHGVLFLRDSPKAHESGPGRIKPTLNAVIGQFKAASARSINEFRGTSGRPFWQFHDRIIRGDEELSRIREYIDQNPVRWHLNALEARSHLLSVVGANPRPARPPTYAPKDGGRVGDPPLHGNGPFARQFVGAGPGVRPRVETANFQSLRGGPTSATTRNRREPSTE